MSNKYKHQPQYDVVLSSRVWCTDNVILRRRHEWSIGYVRTLKRSCRMFWDTEHVRLGISYPKEREQMIPYDASNQEATRKAAERVAYKAILLAIPRSIPYAKFLDIGYHI